MSIAKVYTDGATQPTNPGPGGWAFVVLVNDKEVYKRSGAVIFSTNNRMELLAAIRGIVYVLNSKIADTVVIYSDSQYVVNGINGWVFTWEKNGYVEKKNVDLWKTIRYLHTKIRLSAMWIKGHNGDEYNEMCDQMAEDAAASSIIAEPDPQYSR